MDLSEFVVYDVETANVPDDVKGGWSNPEGMGFSSAVAYSYHLQQYELFLGPEEKDDLVAFLNNKCAVTFNGIRFDSRVLLGNDRVILSEGRVVGTVDGEYTWSNYDILFEYVRSRWDLTTFESIENKLDDPAIHDGSFTLDGICSAMFGRKKIGHGAKAPILYREGKISDLLTYNLHDVVLTRRLFEFINSNRYVLGTDRRVVWLPWPFE